jgi:RNA polymerase sigma-54 factor
MALQTSLDIKLTQRLVLTPQLQQAIKLLQLTQLELSQALNKELTENPLLEEIHEEPVSEQENSSTSMPETETANDMISPLENLISFPVDEYFEERSSDGRDLGYFTPGTDTPPPFEQFLSYRTSLYDHLNWQLRLNVSDEDIISIGEAIIGNLDENGYLTVREDELAAICRAPVERVKEAIAVVQELDPPGICARNLRECLLLQIKALDLEGSLVEEIISNNLKELERKNYQSIAKQHDADIEDVITAVKIIEGLDPKPARNFSSSETNYAVPDVFVTRTSDGYKIILNNEGMPRLRLNKQYRKLLMNKQSLTKEEKKFLEGKLRSAQLLLKSLDHRNKTIYRVTESILRFQKDFFELGPDHLKPLNLKEVATDINMHESTVSRVTSSKYLGCSYGIFSFKHFFSSAIKGRNGSISSTIVKEIIRKTINNEEPLKPLSDQKIVNILKEQNINIARRTVAKYREELKIPPHTRRKKIGV